MFYRIVKSVVCGLVFGFSMTANAAMDIAQFQQTGGDNQSRCVGARTIEYCKGELDYALREGLITKRAYDWGLANGYYPVISRNNIIEAVCKCGCFEQNTAIKVWIDELGLSSIVAAKDITTSNKLVALSSDATLASLNTQDFAIKTITSGEELAELYVFHLANGTQLKVTQHHGMLLSSGKMVAAKDVSTEDAFISADTQDAVEIVRITREATSDNVYNFETNGDDAINHIIVAEGVYAGDVVWQNQLASELGSIALRQ